MSTFRKSAGGIVEGFPPFFINTAVAHGLLFPGKAHIVGDNP
jgi:hypothetical protein